MSLEDIPEAFAEYFGINEGTAQVILSLTVIFALLLPTMVLARGKNAITIYLIILLLAECLLVGLGWMPFWILIATAGMMGISIAMIGRNAIMGE